MIVEMQDFQKFVSEKLSQLINYSLYEKLKHFNMYGIDLIQQLS